MKKISSFLLLGILIITAVHCRNAQKRDTYEYVELKDYPYKISQLKQGTDLLLLAFSGSRNNDKDILNYAQFITLEKETGDTVRILTPLIATEEPGESHETYTTPSIFDGTKGIVDASFEIIDSTREQTLVMESQLSELKPDTEEIKQINTKISTARKWIVVNKSMPVFSNANYKTCIGILKFNKQPW